MHSTSEEKTQNRDAIFSHRVGLPRAERQRILDTIFGNEGLMATVRNPAPNVLDYMQY